MRVFVLWILFFSSSVAQAYPVVPVSDLTPGEYCTETDSNFLYLRYEEQVPFCKRRVKKQLKDRVYEAYNIPARCRSQYTVDHLIPLSMGGNNSIKNLWPEHHRVKELRMDLESEVHFQLEMGVITRDEAVAQVLEDKFLVRPPAEYLEGSNDCDRPEF